MKLLLLVLLVLFSGQLYAVKSDNKIKDYYTVINEAEKYIIAEDYVKANTTFTKAFKMVNGVLFAKDLQNAFFSALYASDYELCKVYIDSLAYYGKNRGWVEKQITKSNKEQILHFGKEYDSLQELGRKRMNQEWIMKCDSFVKIDQEIRKMAKENRETDTRKLAQLDSINFNEFLKNINLKGFPEFKKIGFYTQNSSDPLVTNAFTFLLWHQRGAVFNDSLENSLKKYVLNGWLLPYDYAVTRQVKYEYYGFIPTDHLDKKNIQLLNLHRAEILMETIADYKMKMKKMFKVEGISVKSQMPFVFHNVFVAHTYENQ